MRARCRDLGRMDYAAALDCQRELFEALLHRKSSAKSMTGSHSVPDRWSEAGRTDEADEGRSGTDADGKSCGNDPNAGCMEPGTGDTNGGCKRYGGNDPNAPYRKYGSADADGSCDVSGRNDARGGSDGIDDGEAGVILLVEHPPVYTLGKSGREEHLLVDKGTLEALGARFFRTERGGDITFHGPGQLVCYPILDLERLHLGMRDYIRALEEAVIRTVAQYGIAAGRIAGAAGVWIERKGSAPRKICAIGVRVSRYVTMHGFALNVATDLGWFRHIHPCGFADRGVASMERETGRSVAMDDVKKLVLKNLGELLNVKIYK